MFTECPKDLQAAFSRSYLNGHKIYELHRKLVSLDSEMQDLEKKMDNPATTLNEKSLYRSRFHELQRHRDELNRELTRAEIDGQRASGEAPRT